VSLVVDSSVLIGALIIHGPDGDWAEQILSRGSLYAPELAYMEAMNVLRRFERAAIISTSEAARAIEDLMDLKIELMPFEPFAPRVWDLRHNVTSYDAWYVAIAEALKLPLATLDESLARASGVQCAFVTPASA
jgi:predicted nucleic acid-binding protein